MSAQQPLDAWVAKLTPDDFPILRRSRDRLLGLEQRQDKLTDETLAREIVNDPFLIINLFRKVEAMPRRFLAGDITTIDRAVMMIGMGPFFNWVRSLPILEQQLKGHVAVLEPLMSALACQFHAAFQAWHWSLLRKDISADEVYVATLMQNAICWVGWLQMPDDMEVMRRHIYQDHLNLAVAFKRHTGFELDQLHQALTQAWQLPELYLDFTHGHSAHRGYAVTQALTLVENSHLGWGCPSIEELAEGIADWLQQPVDPLLDDIYRFSDKASEHTYDCYGTASPLMVWKPVEPIYWDESKAAQSHQAGEAPPVSPGAAYVQYEHVLHPAVIEKVIADVRAQARSQFDINQLMARVLTAMHDGLAMDRVVFALLEQNQVVRARFTRGVDEQSPMHALNFQLGKRHLLAQLMAKMQSVWYRPESAAKLKPYISDEISLYIGRGEFMAMSIYVQDKPVGLFYGDYGDAGHMGESVYQGFKQLCLLTAEGLAHLSRSP